MWLQGALKGGVGSLGSAGTGGKLSTQCVSGGKLPGGRDPGLGRAAFSCNECPEGQVLSQPALLAARGQLEGLCGWDRGQEYGHGWECGDSRCNARGKSAQHCLGSESGDRARGEERVCCPGHVAAGKAGSMHRSIGKSQELMPPWEALQEYRPSFCPRDTAGCSGGSSTPQSMPWFQCWLLILGLWVSSCPDLQRCRVLRKFWPKNIGCNNLH